MTWVSSKVLELHCKQCDQLFRPARTWQVFCSPACRLKSWRAGQKEWTGELERWRFVGAFGYSDMEGITMERSAETQNLFEALARCQGAIESPVPDAENKFLNKKYVSLGALWSVARQPLADNGLSVVQFPMATGVTTMICHSSGEFMLEHLTCAPAKAGPQELGKMITYLRRYAFAALLGIVADEEQPQTEHAPAYANPEEMPGPLRGFKSAPETLSEDTVKRIRALLEEHGHTEAELRDDLNLANALIETPISEKRRIWQWFRNEGIAHAKTD